MNIESFITVFECHPKVDEIYVVDDMPFLEPSHAQSHSISTGKPVKGIKRADAVKAAEAAKRPVTEKETSKKGKEADSDPAKTDEQGDDAPETADAEPPAPAAKKGRGKK